MRKALRGVAGQAAGTCRTLGATHALFRGGTSTWREPVHAVGSWTLGTEPRREASGGSRRPPSGAGKQGRMPPEGYAGPSAEVFLARIKSLDTRESVEAVLGSVALPPQHLQVGAATLTAVRRYPHHTAPNSRAEAIWLLCTHLRVHSGGAAAPACICCVCFDTRHGAVRINCTLGGKPNPNTWTAASSSAEQETQLAPPNVRTGPYVASDRCC